MPDNSIKLLNQKEAIELDERLFNEVGYDVIQLMELAGLGVAQAVAKTYPVSCFKRPVIICGPGNNGGDGLVAARHLALFGYEPTVICAKEPKKDLYRNLIKQCRPFGFAVRYGVPEEPLEQLGDLIIDCVFGFSFKPPNNNADYASLLWKINNCCCSDRPNSTRASITLKSSSNNIIEESSTKTNTLDATHQSGSDGAMMSLPLISVDIPSGWHVETGPDNIESDQSSLDQSLKIPSLKPDCLISLTSPKLCSAKFQGRFHYLAGRFCPAPLLSDFGLSPANYPGSEGVILLSKQRNSNLKVSFARQILNKLSKVVTK